MKKLLAFFCLLTLLIPLAACSSSLEAEETAATFEETKTEVKTTEEKGEIVYPDAFAVGYARIDITGSFPVPIFESEANKVSDPLMLTCTAVWDGEEIALLMSLDIRGMTRAVAKQSTEQINKLFGIPAENVIMNCTHTHSAPAAGGGSDASLHWITQYYKKLPIVVEEALRDLDVVESVYAGKGHTDGITFVRRYLMKDGTYDTNPGKGNAVTYESEADTELQTLRFDRKTKKDVLMINYQTHHAGDVPSKTVSADFIHYFREAAEKELDVNFVYHQGAGGNVNFLCAIPGDQKYSGSSGSAEGFMIATREALGKEETVQTGKIRSLARDTTVTVRKEPEELVKLAKKVMAAPETERGTLAAQYGFESWRHANSTIGRSQKGETEDIPLNAITFGEIAFCAFPYEMFDQNGKEVREASPFKVTYVCSLANGSYGYIPTTFAFPHGTYEVNACQYVMGTGEQLAQSMVTMLNECKSDS